MFPERSACSTFKGGPPARLNNAIAEVTLVILARSTRLRSVETRSSAVQCAAPSRPSNVFGSTGPQIVVRTLKVSSAPPRTWIASLLVSNGSKPAGVRYWFLSLLSSSIVTRSTKSPSNAGQPPGKVPIGPGDEQRKSGQGQTRQGCPWVAQFCAVPDIWHGQF